MANVIPAHAELVDQRAGDRLALDLLVQMFLVGHRAKTRQTYHDDLATWFAWCSTNRLDPLQATRSHLELYLRWLEEEATWQRTPGGPTYPYKRASVAKKLQVTCCWYRWLHQEDHISKDPAAHVRRPQVSMESNTLGLDREEIGRFIYTAEASGRPSQYALACLLALNGLRVSEVCDASISDLGVKRGHRVLEIVGKGDKPATIPLVPRTARAVDKAIGDRTEGPILLNTRGTRMNRHSAGWIVEQLGRKAGILGHLHPHVLRHGSVTAALDAGVPLRDVQIFARHADPRTTTRYDRHRTDLDRHAAYVVGAFIAGSA
ncbi:MAG: tyrosine-type recombinase/integrase [Solirubrobacteraceae bacterium]